MVRTMGMQPVSSAPAAPPMAVPVGYASAAAPIVDAQGNAVPGAMPLAQQAVPVNVGYVTPAGPPQVSRSNMHPALARGAMRCRAALSR